MRGHVEIVKFLLTKRADRSIRNKQDEVPIDLCQPCWSDAFRYTRQVCTFSVETARLQRPTADAALACCITLALSPMHCTVFLQGWLSQLQTGPDLLLGLAAVELKQLCRHAGAGMSADRAHAAAWQSERGWPSKRTVCVIAPLQVKSCRRKT